MLGFILVSFLLGFNISNEIHKPKPVKEEKVVDSEKEDVIYFRR